MRRQRLGLIQTPDQLRFSYFAILQGAIQILGIDQQLLFEQELSESEEEDELEESESESESNAVEYLAVVSHLINIEIAVQLWCQLYSQIQYCLVERTNN